MFNYPVKQTPDPNADPANHGAPIEEPIGSAIPIEDIKASQAKAAKEAEAA